jgi:putative transposase
MLVDHLDLLRESLRKVKAVHPFRIDAMVVLPEHLHCIWTLPPGDADYGTRWGLIKAGFSRGVSSPEARSKSRKKRGERGIWQRRFWEHTIRGEQDFQRHFDYIHWNPVKHGLVERVADWPYSTFHRYALQGILPVDWAWAGEGDMEVGER